MSPLPPANHADRPNREGGEQREQELAAFHTAEPNRFRIKGRYAISTRPLLADAEATAPAQQLEQLGAHELAPPARERADGRLGIAAAGGDDDRRQVRARAAISS